jgi:two-component system, OmpR family, sensor kinase
VNRLPIRVRLSLAFAGAMAIVLAALGGFLHFRLEHSLDEQIDASLHAQADAAARGAVVVEEETITQILAPSGEVVRGFRTPLAKPATRRHYTERDVRGLDDGPFRLLVVPAADGRTIVAGASLEERNEALNGLLAAFVIGGPIALALSTLLGYLLAGALLRPVESMRRRAADISADTAGERLPLPHARDEIFRLGRTLNEMLGRLEEGLARERRFVADASHELRTPLAVLRAELELARRRPRSTEELRAALDSAAEEIERLARLAEDLLVLARADEHGLPLQPEPIEVRELLETVAGRFGDGVEVSAVDGETIVGDRLRLEQALGNLVDNARRHGAGTVRLDAEPREDRIALRVSDEGPGFPPGFLPHAFERFTRGDEARERGGAGLGLAIVDAIARAHGGRAHAANASVTIELPRDG